MKRMFLIVLAVLMFVPGAFGQGYICKHMRWSTMLGCYIPDNYRWSTAVGGYVCRSARYSFLAPAYCHPPCYQRNYCCWLVIHRVDCGPSVEIISSGPSPSCSAKRARKPREPRNRDGLWIVYYYLLQDKGLDVDLVDSFCCKDQIVGAFLKIRSEKLLIKYRSLEAEKSLAKNPAWQGFYSKYKERWSEKEREYQLKGWKIGQVFG